MSNTSDSIQSVAAYTTGIIDVAHHETASVAHLEEAKKKGLLAVIAKCTQGVGYVDPAYTSFRDECKRLGLLFGSYAFGSGEHSGKEQARFFLDHADPDSLLALDWEWQQKKTLKEMTTAHAEEFVSYIHEQTGRHPVVYTSKSWVHECKPMPLWTSVLANCPLWLCWYVDRHPERALPRPWASFDLWQYTNGTAGPDLPRETPVLGHVDRNAFLGGEDALREWWKNCGRVNGPQCR